MLQLGYHYYHSKESVKITSGFVKSNGPLLASILLAILVTFEADFFLFFLTPQRSPQSFPPTSLATPLLVHLQTLVLESPRAVLGHLPVFT